VSASDLNNNTDDPMDGLELCGEEAESFVDTIEVEVANSGNPEFMDEETDFKKRLKLKIAVASREALTRQIRELDETRTCTSSKSKLPEFVALSSVGVDEEGLEWEREILKRGLRLGGVGGDYVNNTTLHKLNAIIQGNAHSGGSSNDDSGDGDSYVMKTGNHNSSSLTMEDMQLSIAEAINSMREHLYRDERRLDAVKVDLNSCSVEETALRTSLDSKIMLVNTVQVRLFSLYYIVYVCTYNSYFIT
jgi:hypothetical protein